MDAIYRFRQWFLFESRLQCETRGTEHKFFYCSPLYALRTRTWSVVGAWCASVTAPPPLPSPSSALSSLLLFFSSLTEEADGTWSWSFSWKTYWIFLAWTEAVSNVTEWSFHSTMTKTYRGILLLESEGLPMDALMGKGWSVIVCSLRSTCFIYLATI